MTHVVERVMKKVMLNTSELVFSVSHGHTSSPLLYCEIFRPSSSSSDPSLTVPIDPFSPFIDLKEKNKTGLFMFLLNGFYPVLKESGDQVKDWILLDLVADSLLVNGRAWASRGLLAL